MGAGYNAQVFEVRQGGDEVTGIYCIEATWDERHSVKKPLAFVAEAHEAGRLIHRRVGTPEEFERALSLWARRTDWKYPILYLGFHGFARGVQVGEGTAPLRDYVRWEQIADLVADREPDEWRWEGCVMHFSACSTMDAADSDLAGFLAATELEAVSGYGMDVGWMASMAFDMMWLDALLVELGDQPEDASEGVAVRTARLCRDRLLNSVESRDFAGSLGFSMVTKDDFA